MGYYEESLRPRSEKITLVTVNAVQRVKLFSLNGSDYEKLVPYFVIGVKDGTTILTKNETLPLTLNQFHFDPFTKTLTVNVGADPKTKNLSISYRFFFSNAPFNLPYDLDEGVDVEWEPIIDSVGSIGQQLDEENTGIVLESSSSISFKNADGRFDAIYDTLIWENQEIKFYSWFPTIPISERKQIFEGVIESKAFSESMVTFKVKDFVFKLKNQVNLNVFEESEGTILPSLVGTPKRRIYGQVDYLNCASLDATLDGFTPIGTVSGSLASTTITGISTEFLDCASPGDEAFIVVSGIQYKIGIETVDSDTQLTTSKPLEVSFSGASIKIKPQIPWRKKNRTWHVAGHKLRSPSVEILIVQSANTFFVSSVEDFGEGDEVLVNGFQTTVRRVSGSKIITSTNVVPTPSVSDLIVKRPISAVYKDASKFSYSRDYLEINTSEAYVVFQDTAEFNIAEQRKTGVSLTFTNASRTVTTSATVDLRTIVSPRDWIRSTNVARTTWYEVLQVNEQVIVLRTPVSVSGGPHTEEAYYKNIIPIDENSLITVNCLGMEVDDLWIKTPSDAVRHLVLNDAGFAEVNEEKFSKAKSDCNYILSLFIPERLGSRAPLIRDVITNINNSVFGSLYGDSSENISFSVLNSSKPIDEDIIRDDDIISYSIDTNQKIANKVIVNYRPFTDIYTGADATKTYTHTSSFVDELIGIKNTTERKLFLYEDDKAIIIAQRIALFNSLSSSSVKIKAKLIFAEKQVNDKVFLSLDRLYDRYGGYDRRKIGSITGIKKDGYGTEITVTDLGNIYNRIPSVAPNDASAFSSASDEEKIRWGYFLDNDTLTPDPASEEGLGNGIIG